MSPKSFASRKFLLFLLVTLVATWGWIYALISRPDQLMTVSTFILTLLGGYGGANLTATYLHHHKPPEAPTGKPHE